MKHFNVVRYKGAGHQNCKLCFMDNCKHCGEDSDMICTQYFPCVPVGYDNKTIQEIRESIKKNNFISVE